MRCTKCEQIKEILVQSEGLQEDSKYARSELKRLFNL